MRYQKIISGLLLICVSIFVKAQIYSDYIGAGHSEGVTVTSSSNSNQSDAINAINGSGLGIDEYGAARFLNYASLGADYENQTFLQSGATLLTLGQGLAGGVRKSTAPTQRGSNCCFDHVVVTPNGGAWKRRAGQGKQR